MKKRSNIQEEIKRICAGKKSWKDLETKLQRPSNTIGLRWSRFIHPTIVSYLIGTVNLQWKKGFLQFIIDKKYVSSSDIEWNTVLKKWPCCTKPQLLTSLDHVQGDKG